MKENYNSIIISYFYYIRGNHFIEFYADIDNRGLNVIIFDDLNTVKYIDTVSDLLDFNKDIHYKKIVKSDKFDNIDLTDFIDIVTEYAEKSNCLDRFYIEDQYKSSIYKRIKQTALKYPIFCL